jgi:hypothetical protein
MNSKAYVCKFKDCNLIYENPITLPCGHSLCQNHLETTDEKFMCQFCEKEHIIPENGFFINKTIVQLIEEYVKSNPIRKEIKQTFDQLAQLVKEYSEIDPDVYVYDYFSKIRNKVDLHREELIEQINSKSDEIIQQLKVKEEKCKLNATKLEKMSLTKVNEEISCCKKKMRSLNINKHALNDILTKIKDFVKKIQNESSKYNQALFLNNESIEFEKYQGSSFFGQLASIKSIDSISTKENDDLTIKYNKMFLNTKLANPSTDNTIKVMNIETNECLKSSKDHIDCINCVLHPNPAWTYRKYDCSYLLELLKQELSDTFGNDLIKSATSVVNKGKSDPIKFSIWLLNNIPFDSKTRSDGLKINCINHRLIFVYELLKKYTNIVCKNCKATLCSKSDTFTISDINLFLSPGKNLFGIEFFYI